jgi:hypothetical protein
MNIKKEPETNENVINQNPYEMFGSFETRFLKQCVWNLIQGRN